MLGRSGSGSGTFPGTGVKGATSAGSAADSPPSAMRARKASVSASGATPKSLGLDPVGITRAVAELCEARSKS